MKTITDKKNDPNWCMQYIGLGLSIAFLIIGLLTFDHLGDDFRRYGFIFGGFLWLVVASVHRIKWKRKVERHGTQED